MIRKISIRTRVGWISVFEKEGKIFKIIFGRLKNQIKSKILENFKKNLFKCLISIKYYRKLIAQIFWEFKANLK